MSWSDDVIFFLAVEPHKNNKAALDAFARQIRETAQQIGKNMAQGFDLGVHEVKNRLKQLSATASGGMSGSGAIGVVPLVVEPHKNNKTAIDAFTRQIRETAQQIGKDIVNGFDVGIYGLKNRVRQLTNTGVPVGPVGVSGSGGLSGTGGGVGGSVGGFAGIDEYKLASIDDAKNRFSSMSVESEKALQNMGKATDTATNKWKKMFDELDRVGTYAAEVSDLTVESDKNSVALSKNFREIAATAENAASGVGQMASGLAFLTAGNEDAKKLIETLLMIKGVSDVFLGGVKALSGMAQAHSLLRERQELQGKSAEVNAEKTRAAKTAADAYLTMMNKYHTQMKAAAKDNAEFAKSLEIVEHQLKQVAAAQGQVNAGSGGVGGPMPSVGGGGRFGRIGRMGRGIIGSVGGMLLGEAAYGVAGSVGTSVVAGAGSAAGGGAAGLGGLVTLAGPITAAAGAIVGVGASAIRLTEYLTGASKNVDSWSQKMDRATEPLGQWFTLLDNQARKDQERVDAIQEAILAERERTSIIQSQNEQQRGLVAQAESARSGVGRAMDQGLVASGRLSEQDFNKNEMGRIQNELSLRQKALQEYEKAITEYGSRRNMSDEDYVKTLGEAEQLQMRLLETQRSQISLVQREADERKKANDVAIDGLKKQREEWEKVKEESQRNLSGAAERFADLSLMDKQQAIKAKQKLDSQGFASLNRSERDALANIGTSDAQEAVKQSRLKEAESFGFTQMFGRRETNDIAIANNEIRKTDQEILAKTQLNVRVDIDRDFISQAIVNEMQKLKGQIQADVDKKLRSQGDKIARDRIAENAFANMQRNSS